MFSFLKKRYKAILLVFILLFIGTFMLIALNLGKIISNNKDLILSKAEEALGRKVQVETIDVTLWKGIGATLTGVSVADDPAFSEEPFLHADSVQLYFHLLPLLKKRLEISYVTVQKPSIRIMENEKGQYNFSSLVQPKNDKSPSLDQPASTTGSSSPSITLSRFEIQEGSVQYLPKTTSQALQFDPLSVVIRKFSFEHPFPVSITTSLLDEKPNCTFQGAIHLASSPAQKIGIEGKLNLDSLALQKILAYPPFKNALPLALKIDGTLQAHATLKGNVDHLQLQTTLDLTQASIAYASYFQKPLDTRLQMTSELTLSKGKMDIAQYKLILDAMEMQGQGNVQLGSTPGYVLSLHSNQADIAPLAALSSLLPPYEPSGTVQIKAQFQQKDNAPSLEGTLTLGHTKLSIPHIPKPLSNLNGAIRFDLQQAQSEEITFTVGKSEIHLKANVRQYTPPVFNYTIQVPQLNLSDVAVVPDSMHQDYLKNVRFLGKLDLTSGLSSNGRVISEAGQLYNTAYSNLAGSFALQDGIFSTTNISMTTLKGKATTQLTYNMNETPPTFDISTTLDAIDIVELAGTRFPLLPKILEGRINTKLQLSGRGSTWNVIRPTLKGKGTVEIIDGILLNTNIVDSVLKGMTGMPGVSQFMTQDLRSQYPSIFGTQHTAFDQLKMETLIQDGKININNLLITAADWYVGGKGWVDFDRTLQSEGMLKLSKGFTDTIAGKVKVFHYLADENGQMTIPFSLAGSLPRLTPKPNGRILQTLFQKAVMGQLSEKFSKNLEQSGFPDLFPLPFNLPNPAGVKRSKPATSTIRKPTQINPLDIMNPFLKLLDKKRGTK